MQNPEQGVRVARPFSGSLKLARVEEDQLGIAGLAAGPSVHQLGGPQCVVRESDADRLNSPSIGIVLGGWSAVVSGPVHSRDRELASGEASGGTEVKSHNLRHA